MYVVSVFSVIIRDSPGSLSLLNERLVSEGLATCVSGVSNSCSDAEKPTGTRGEGISHSGFCFIEGVNYR